MLDEMLEDINHDQKRMKPLEGVFLDKKLDSDILYTIPKMPKSIFFFSENVVFVSVQIESKKGYFGLTNE